MRKLLDGLTRSQRSYRRLKADPERFAKYKAQRKEQRHHHYIDDVEGRERRSAIQKMRLKTDPEYRIRRNKSNSVSWKAMKQTLRKEFYEKYGGKCNCCGEGNWKFLTIDHVQNDGGKERKALSGNSIALYKKALERIDPERYQILCYNCNCGRAYNGDVCPHKEGCARLNG